MSEKKPTATPQATAPAINPKDIQQAIRNLAVAIRRVPATLDEHGALQSSLTTVAAALGMTVSYTDRPQQAAPKAPPAAAKNGKLKKAAPVVGHA